METLHIYAQESDMQHMSQSDEEDYDMSGVTNYLEDEFKLLERWGRPSHWNCVDGFYRHECFKGEDYYGQRRKLVDSHAQLSSDVELMEPIQIYQIYPKQFDISGVPRKFISTGHRDGYYAYPHDDIELLEWCRRPLRWNRVDGFHSPKIYEVKVEAKSCTLAECLELLKRIDRENRFIACSVESASLFFAELNKEDARKLKGFGEIHDVFPHDDRVVQS